MRNVFVALLLLGGASAAHADIIPTLTASSPVPVGSLFAYTYTATLAADQQLETGNFFTIYDFFGFSGFGSLAAGFSGSTAFLGRTPDQVLPNDSASVLNVTFTYNGATVNEGPNGVSTELGSFTVFSRFDGTGPLEFASQAIKNTGFAAGTPVANIGQVGGPLNGDGSGNVVPEPETWALLTIGFGFVGAAVRRRRQTYVAA